MTKKNTKIKSLHFSYTHTHTHTQNIYWILIWLCVVFHCVFSIHEKKDFFIKRKKYLVKHRILFVSQIFPDEIDWSVSTNGKNGFPTFAFSRHGRVPVFPKRNLNDLFPPPLVFVFTWTPSRKFSVRRTLSYLKRWHTDYITSYYGHGH